MKLTKLKLQGCIIFLCGRNKRPQTWKLKPKQIYSLPIPEATSLRLESLGSHHSVCRTTLPLEDKRISVLAPPSFWWLPALLDLWPLPSSLCLHGHIAISCVKFPFASLFFWKNTFYCLSIRFFFHLIVPGLSCDMWDQVPWPGIKPGFPALGAQNLSHWTIREAPASPLWKYMGLHLGPTQII